MYWKEQRVWKQVLLPLNGTTRIELHKTGKVSGLKLHFVATNAALLDVTLGERIVDHITRIKVVDGKGRTLMSLTGQELKALNFYSEGDVMPEQYINVLGDVQQTTMFLPFGRFYKDPDFILDFGPWCGLWLEITNDATAAVFTADTLLMDIIEVEAKELSRTPVNWIKHFEWLTQKPSAAGQDIIQELPAEESIHKIMIQLDPDLDANGLPVNDPKIDTNLIKMMFNDMEKVVTELRPLDLMRDNAIEYGRPHARGRTLFSVANYNDLKLALIESMTSCRVDGISTADIFFNQEDSWGRFQKAVLIGPNITYIQWDAVGYGLYHTMMLWDSMKVQGDDLLELTCCGNKNSPGHIVIEPTAADFTLKTVISTLHRQGEM